jgi:hypothetical protein
MIGPGIQPEVVAGKFGGFSVAAQGFAERAGQFHATIVLVEPRKISGSLARQTGCNIGQNSGRYLMRPSTIFASVLGIVLGTSSPALAGDTSCGSLDIRIKSEIVKGEQKCSDGQFGRIDDGIVLTESIEVEGARFSFFLDHVEAGTRTYLTRKGFDQVLDDGTNFERFDDMTVHAAGKGYSARKFIGVLPGGTSYPCFAIVRYAGNAFSGPRHLVFGLYCGTSGDDIEDARIDEVIEAIDTDF